MTHFSGFEMEMEKKQNLGGVADMVCVQLYWVNVLTRDRIRACIDTGSQVTHKVEQNQCLYLQCWKYIKSYLYLREILLVLEFLPDPLVTFILETG